MCDERWLNDCNFPLKYLAAKPNTVPSIHCAYVQLKPTSHRHSSLTTFIPYIRFVRAIQPIQDNNTKLYNRVLTKMHRRISLHHQVEGWETKNRYIVELGYDIHRRYWNCIASLGWIRWNSRRHSLAAKSKYAQRPWRKDFAIPLTTGRMENGGEME